MKISVILIDGSFRQKYYGADYFSRQKFFPGEYEVIWVEFYSGQNPGLKKFKKIKFFDLKHDKRKMYHSSYCFNEGIRRASGEIIVIADADVIVRPDFLLRVWNVHINYDDLVVYGYRYNEKQKGQLEGLTFDELERRCVITNPINYGACLTVRKKWLLAINGYEQNEIFKSGFHSNGLDVYTRFRNYGLAIKWDKSLKLYHPWHEMTAKSHDNYSAQRKFINWRSKNLEFLTLDGIIPDLNSQTFCPMAK